MSSEQIQLDIIKTDKYSNTVDPLTKDEYEELKQSIKKEGGLWEPITISPQGDVLDGHHRYRACQELGMKPEFKVKESKNELEEQLFVIDSNLIRRQLNDYQRGILVLKKKPILTERAKRNMSLAAKGDKILSPLNRVNEELAKQAGDISREQLRKIEILEERAPEDMKKKLRSGGKKIGPAYSELQRAEDRYKPKPAPPQGQYDVLYVDPPWSYEFSAVRGSAENHYAVMTEEELMRLPLPASDNAILFLWVPYPKSREAFDVIDAWGFVFKSKIVWVKDKIGTGHYVRAKHEELFICVKGEGLGLPAEQDRPESVVFAERMEHSRKPEIFYEIIDDMYPGRTRIELFARGEAREGWKTWGLEVTTTGRRQKNHHQE